MRRLVAFAFVDRVAHQLAQVLAIGLRIFHEQFGQCRVAFGQQAVAPGFGPVQLRGFASRRVAAGIQRIADRIERGIVLAPHLLGQERQLPLVRDVRRDALGLDDVRQQVFRDRQLRQLRRAQRDQLLAQCEHVQRRASLFAAAGAEVFAGVFVASAHRGPFVSRAGSSP